MKKLVVIIVALLVSLTVLAQKMVGTVVLRDSEGNIKECYSDVTITSYEETEEGILTSVHFVTKGGREYILCGVNISLEDVKYVDKPTVVYVRPTYRYRYYDYWPSPRPYVRPVPPRPRPHTGPGAPPRQHYHQPSHPRPHTGPGAPNQYSQHYLPSQRHHTGPGAPPRSNNHPRGRR